jgi:hypothetical protein
MLHHHVMCVVTSKGRWHHACWIYSTLTPDVLRRTEKGGVFGWTVLTAINWAKFLTLATIALCVLQHGGLNNMRQVRSACILRYGLDHSCSEWPASSCMKQFRWSYRCTPLNDVVARHACTSLDAICKLPVCRRCTLRCTGVTCYIGTFINSPCQSGSHSKILRACQF